MNNIFVKGALIQNHFQCVFINLGEVNRTFTKEGKMTVYYKLYNVVTKNTIISTDFYMSLTYRVLS